jgi:transcription elongation factor Elf1
MNCPNCGHELPAGLGQHAVAPDAHVVDCPNCGARVNEETGALEAVSAAGRAEEQGGAPIEAGRPERFSGEETVEGVMDEIEQKEQS